MKNLLFKSVVYYILLLLLCTQITAAEIDHINKADRNLVILYHKLFGDDSKTPNFMVAPEGRAIIENDLNFLLKETPYELINDEYYIDVTITLNGSPDQLKGLDLFVPHRYFGNIISTTIKLSQLNDIALLDEVVKVSASCPVVQFGIDLDTANAIIGSDSTRELLNVSGDGVIVGIVDYDIDVYHEDFRTASGSRIIRLWDQDDLTGSPGPFPKGSFFDNNDIDNFLYNAGVLIRHGTLVTGVAAGNGHSTIPSLQDSMIGIAPGADIVFVGQNQK